MNPVAICLSAQARISRDRSQLLPIARSITRSLIADRRLRMSDGGCECARRIAYNRRSLEKADIPSTLAGRDFPLGVPGFRYQDLHREERLADLDSAFLTSLTAEDPA